MKYDKKSKAKEVMKVLENVNYRDWNKIKNFIDDNFSRINNESNFKCDEVIQNRIDSWF